MCLGHLASPFAYGGVTVGVFVGVGVFVAVRDGLIGGTPVWTAVGVVEVGVGVLVAVLVLLGVLVLTCGRFGVNV